MKYVFMFGEIKDFSNCGGKGGVLAKLYQRGYRIPNGFIIIPGAFEKENLKKQAGKQVLDCLKKLKTKKFAARSSALAEDSLKASFAGEFESFLNLNQVEVIEAVHKVHASRKSKRVKAYSRIKGIKEKHEIAVIVQEQIPSEYSGVLFTSDPVSGSHNFMVGNYVKGLGDKLVSGKVSAKEFKINKSNKECSGLKDLENYRKDILKLGNKLEKFFKTPQDIEFAIHNNKLILLQSRPITTFFDHDEITQLWNSSFRGDYLWIAQETFPEKVTPSTWSLWRYIMDMELSGMPAMGNICGRLYINGSATYSIIRKFGISHKTALRLIESAVGKIPSEFEVPVQSCSFRNIFDISKNLVSKYGGYFYLLKVRINSQKMLKQSPETHDRLVSAFKKCRTPKELAGWWLSTRNYFRDMFNVQDGSNKTYLIPYMFFERNLKKWVGEEKALMIISSSSAVNENLESVGIGVGLNKIVSGEMTREEYLQKFGHRHFNENELSQKRPYEGSAWLDEQLREYKKNNFDFSEKLSKRQGEFEKLLESVGNEKTVKKIRKSIDKVSSSLENRERVRSELTRSLDAARQYYLKAGELLGIGDDVFLITISELQNVLNGDRTVLSYLPERKKAWDRCRKLPKLPVYVRGRFDPFKWAKDSDRRNDIFGIETKDDNKKLLKGMPGSFGRIKGKVRVLNSFKEASKLKKGEILVTTTTNVGWTPIFPKLSAVVTETGASLAHAAVVARELGIPAVVSVRGAASKLKTGDIVIVDGGKGTVELVR